MAATEEAEHIESEFAEQFWTLDNIPKELFLHICSFLSSKFIVNVLSKVCMRFKCLIEDDVTWRIRLRSRWPRLYPIIRTDDFSWKDACCAREEHYRLWSNNGANMKKYHIAGAHFAAVDVVHIIEDGKLCASGSRDHAIKLWDLEGLDSYNEEDLDMYRVGVQYQLPVENSHTGWIWSMAYSNEDKTLFTGSWDSQIKSWDIQDYDAQAKQTFKATAPVLCLALSNNVLVSGSYDRAVSLYDPRASISPISREIHHRKPVLCIAADERYVISGSEDHTVVVYDIAAGKVHSIIELEGYPMSLSYGNNHLWIGDNLGNLNLINPTCEKFELIKTYPSGHRGQITGIQYSLGSIITSSLDKTLRVLEPNSDPKTIATFEFSSVIAGISTYNDIVVHANSDDSITVWMPKAR